jgi:hypothetical protein
MVGSAEAAAYLAEYVRAYREEYERLIEPPPKGPGFPAIVDSVYLDSPALSCLLARDGAVIADFSREPAYEWHVAGGPALVVDQPDSRVPGWWTDLIEFGGLTGKPLGLYRIVSEKPLPDEIWHGLIPKPIDDATAVVDETTIEASRLDLGWSELIERLTFGAYGGILDIHLPADDAAPLWQPTIVRGLGFVTADRERRRFFRYLELLRHVDLAAWDARSLWARAKLDVRRDFAHAVAVAGEPGGTVQLASAPRLMDELFVNRLAALDRSISEFEQLLSESESADESVFHEFLVSHPLLIDIYGEVVSQPRFEYPAGSSPLGKQFVEPDFIVRRPLGRYRLIELERPSKSMATKRGEARAEVSQAIFQIGEFRDFILEHYDVLRDDFPGINRSHETTVVISRARAESFGGRSNVERHLQLLREQFSGIDELLTYDDLLIQAKSARDRLAGIAGELG